MSIELLEQPFEPWAKLAQYQHPDLRSGAFGATCTFVGNMRDFNLGDNVSRLWIEHYPGMTETQLQSILAEAKAQWPIQHALISHRIGRIEPGEAIVLLACWSAHRQAAFESCQFLIEALKQRATFWKKETLDQPDQTRWVANNTPYR